MSGRADSDMHPEQTESAGNAEKDEHKGAEQATYEDVERVERSEYDDQDLADQDEEEGLPEARRARWVSAGTGAALTVAGLAAALLRLTGAAPPLVPVAYACGAAVCALAAVLGSRGRTRRALWLLIAGLMVMALGDQFD